MADYYIATTGNNANNGSIGSPWRNLSYAGDHATSVGDIIHVNAGTYTETDACILRPGVSIEGVGVTSWIKSHFTATRLGDVSGASINLTSASEGTDGNQHITGIKLDGDSWTGSIGILVFKRKNVLIHDCTIMNFNIGGIAMHGTAYQDEPSTYATGNQIYNNIFSGNGDTDTTWDGMGQIEIGAQDGLLIHDNNFDGTTRTVGHNGNILSGCWFNKGIKYYNNKSYKLGDEGGAWNFHIEMWNSMGGWEVYDNEFHGGDNPIDIAGDYNYKGSYAYSWFIHDNLFDCDPSVISGKNAIQMEDTYCEDVWIYRNRFTNWPCAINTTNGGSSPTQVLKRIYIAYNIFDYENPWTGDDDYFNIFRLRCAVDAGDFDGFHILNNVIIGPSDAYSTAIKLEVESGASFLNLEIKNNIIIDNANATWLNVENAGTINGMDIEYNILYNNASDNDPAFSGNAVVNYTFENNTIADPGFVSSTDFHLTSEHDGIAVTLPTTWKDYDNVTLASPPTIGVYEYGIGGGTVYVTGVSVSGAGGATTITVRGGTLQLTANITPLDATDKTVVWSVINGTGQATINSSGLLTAIADGTVTVKAVANG